MRNSDIVGLSDVLVIGSGFASDYRACLFCGDCILSGESTCFTCPNLFLRRLRSVCVGDVAVFRGFTSRLLKRARPKGHLFSSLLLDLVA